MNAPSKRFSVSMPVLLIATLAHERKCKLHHDDTQHHLELAVRKIESMQLREQSVMVKMRGYTPSTTANPGAGLDLIPPQVREAICKTSVCVGTRTGMMVVSCCLM